MTDTNRYKILAELVAEQKALSQRIDVLKEVIYAELMDMDGEKLETEQATYSISYRPRWAYSPELTQRIKDVTTKIKQLRKEEETTGKAEKLSDGGFIRIQLTNQKGGE